MKKLFVFVVLVLCVFSASAETMGTFDMDGSGVRAPMEWIVIAEEGERELLLSRYAIDARPFNGKKEPQTWETSDLRQWLNGAFLESCFTPEEQSRILRSYLDNPANPEHGTSSGNPTEDRIFLLSSAEVEAYLPDAEAKQCEPAPIARAHGAMVIDGLCIWWLRTSGIIPEDAVVVMQNGVQTLCGMDVTRRLACVRPAMWVHKTDTEEER